ncbi:endolytic transglycosylase MltG [Candidatus Saccharibacteria bacterium]|nr:endolytic transglycosylase MltG [Candidatus Saccharibacteria bacterium]
MQPNNNQPRDTGPSGPVIVAAAGAVWWYQQQLLPVSPGTTNHVRLTIEAGTSPNAIGEQLKAEGLIRSKTAFSVYTKLSSTESTLKAGIYNLAPSESMQEIVDHLVSGKQDTFSMTFLPGDTLANNRKKLIDVGYSADEVDAALSKTYSRPLFAGKPASADLEGYIYGETYEFDSAAGVEAILNRTFDEYEKAITQNDLVNGFKKQGLTLYEGITLASIIQREVRGDEDERQVAKVFLNRLELNMSLGSDVTYQYAAKKMGVDPTPLLESPYNTRKYTGLPPGPISAPGIGALKAVANPGNNNYLFFLSGDDDVTYFATTDAEHQRNIVNHCKAKCLIN